MKVIILDFDGVIVESNSIKEQAFSELFKEYPQQYEEMMHYHFLNIHVNRYDKFKYIIENILKLENKEENIEKMVRRFTEFTREKIISCPFVDGAKEFIEFFSLQYSMYIASTTPLSELEITLRSRGLSKFFKGIYGAPMKKEEMLRLIIGKERISPPEALFIGDSIEDYKAAKGIGISFLARVSGEYFTGLDLPKFNDLHEIKSFLLKDKTSIAGKGLVNGKN